MSLGNALTYVEVFHAPKLFSDHFLEVGWVQTPTGQVTLDGDAATLTIKSGQTLQHFSKALSIPVVNPLALVFRVNSRTATWQVYLMLQGDSSWRLVTSGTATGLQQVDLYYWYTHLSSPPSSTITDIDLVASGSAGQNVVFDYCAITGTFLIPCDGVTTFDAVEELQLIQSIWSRGVGGCTFKLPNIAGQYTGKVCEFDHVLLWVARTGLSPKKVFGGKITKPTSSGNADTQEFYIPVECMDYGEEAQAPPATLTKNYVAENGKTIIQEAVALCNYLSAAGVDVENAIASLFSETFDDASPDKVLKAILPAAETSGGAVGFDGYVSPPGVLQVFARGSRNSTVDLAGVFQVYIKEDDALRVRNAYIVYGASTQVVVEGGVNKTVPLKMVPATGDDWTYGTGWVLDLGVQVIANSSDKKIGSDSLEADSAGISGIRTIQFHRALPSTLVFVGKSAATNVHFYWKYHIGGLASMQHEQIRLYAPDASNYFYVELTNPNDTWKEETTIPVGPDQVYDAITNPSGKWVEVGSPDWNNISDVCFYVQGTPGSSNDTFYFLLDDLYFSGMPCVGTAMDTDAARLAKYGVRWADPVTDTTLASDEACALAAAGKLAYTQDKVVTLKVSCVGNYDFVPGYMQHVVLANEGVDAYFRILEVTHSIIDVYWTSELLLSDEPVMMDYLMRVLAKQSQGSGGGSSGGGAGGFPGQLANLEIINQLTLDNLLVLKDNGDVLVDGVPTNVANPSGNYIDIFASVISPLDHSTVLSDPMFCINQALFIEKDTQTFGFLGTSSDPYKHTGGGAILMGEGFQGRYCPPLFDLTGTIIGMSDPLGSYPSGTSNPTSGMNPYDYFYRTDRKSLWCYISGAWAEKYFDVLSADYDTLFLLRADTELPANLYLNDLDALTLTIRGNGNGATTSFTVGITSGIRYLVPDGSDKTFGFGSSGHYLKFVDSDQLFCNQLLGLDHTYITVQSDFNFLDTNVAFYRPTTGTQANKDSLRVQTPSDGGLIVEQNLWAKAFSTDNAVGINIAIGTAPLSVISTTMCPNLNADLLDGHHWSEVPSAYITSVDTNPFKVTSQELLLNSTLWSLDSSGNLTLAGNLTAIGYNNSYNSSHLSTYVLDVTASRALGTDYTNNTGYDKVIVITIITAPAGSSYAIWTTLYVDGVKAGRICNSLYNYMSSCITAIVPNGSTYSLHNNWSENTSYSWIDSWIEYAL